MAGSVTHNGYTADEFVVQRTAAYVDQVDNHIAELTVCAGFERYCLYSIVLAAKLPCYSTWRASDTQC